MGASSLLGNRGACRLREGWLVVGGWDINTCSRQGWQNAEDMTVVGLPEYIPDKRQGDAVQRP